MREVQSTDSPSLLCRLYVLTGNRQHSRNARVDMASGKETTDEEEFLDDGCIFCLIANEEDKEAEVIQRSNELVCFKDICPAAPHHYLVVPRKHIMSCLLLNKEQIGLVEKMAEMGKDVLRARGVTDMNDISLGFHQPPYTSVDHLHLHVLAPKSQISTLFAHKFIPDSPRFITERTLRRCLQEITPPHNCLFDCLSFF
ncbi:histidine triad nucleotide-binding protein 3-like [Gouania willdenowi]|uniref:Histidine triad nucleotide-binding protein 3-like n=1 Tax=Gouania willdenowi TaxID=441366 RepID=A0A8C5NGX6_GOUWI|nr:histidine triad nucleotide-binding protein 3-like [Gouania willdenowi]